MAFGGPGGHGPGGFGPGGLGGGFFGGFFGGFLGRNSASPSISTSNANYDSLSWLGRIIAKAQDRRANRIAVSQQSSSTTSTSATTQPNPVNAGNADNEEYIDIFPSTSTRLGANYLTILCLILGCAMCMSNICAVKIWHIGPIILDGGIFLFPATYVVTDVLVGLFYRRYANKVINWCCAVNIACFLVLQLTSKLPAAPGTDQVDIASALGLSSRIFIASVISMIISSRVNNRIYDWIRVRTLNNKRGIFTRSWVSSLVAHAPDSFIFTFLAFAGRQSSLGGLLQQAFTSYAMAFVVESLLMPVTIYLTDYMTKRIKQAQ